MLDTGIVNSRRCRVNELTQRYDSGSAVTTHLNGPPGIAASNG